MLTSFEIESSKDAQRRGNVASEKTSPLLQSPDSKEATGPNENENVKDKIGRR